MPRISHPRLARALVIALSMTAGASWTGPANAQTPTPDEGSAKGAPNSSATPSPEPPPTPIGVSGSLANSLVLRGITSETTLLTVLSVSYAWTSSFSTFARMGSVYNSSSGLESATDLANPVIGVTLQFDVTRNLTIGGQSGLMAPWGTGGGDSPSPGAQRAWMNSFDWGGAMFAVNHFDVFNGVRASYTIKKLNLEIETELHELFRVRGEDADPLGPTLAFTWSMAKISYEVLPVLSLWTALGQTFVWSTPTFVVDDPSTRADHFFMAGASTSFKLSGVDFSPGLLYARALDLPLRAQGFQVAELDLGFAL